jgi:hypothetical protein
MHNLFPLTDEELERQVAAGVLALRSRTRTPSCKSLG